MKSHLSLMANWVCLCCFLLPGTFILANGTPPISYLYDELARLTQVTYPDGRQLSYSYDDNGNLTSVKTLTRELSVPIITAPLIGRVGEELLYPIQASTTATVTGYSVKGLPPGLKINSSTQTNRDGQPGGVIYGMPTKGGSYTASIAIRTAAGIGPSIPLAINISNPFTTVARGFSLTGAFSGAIDPSTIVGGESGGWLTLKTISTGSVSGRLTLGASQFSFRTRIDPSSGIADPVTITRRHLPPLTLTFNLPLDPLSSEWGRLDAMVSDGTDAASARLERETWGKSLPATAFAGSKSTRYNTIWKTDPAHSSDAYPQGLGHAAITVTPNGLAKLAGKLADGTPFTQARMLWQDGNLSVFVPLYAKKGSLSARYLRLIPGTDASTADNSVIASHIHWLRPPSSKPSDRLFAAGFSTSLSVVGGTYTPPAKGQRVLDLGSGTSHSSISLALTQGGLTSPLLSSVTLSTSNKVTAIIPNLNSISLQFAPTTGLISGKFKDGTRSAAFSGLIVPANSTDPAEAYGFFLLPGISTSAPTLSGSVFVGPNAP